MQTGQISFCNKTALNIKSEDVKKKILNELESKYNIKILHRHFDVFNNQVSLGKLQKSPYLFCLKSNGNPYYMFLTKLNNINTCLLIDKKIQQGYFLPRMIIVHYMFDDHLFNNTLFDGEMVKDKNNHWVYILNDIYVYNNTYLIDSNLIKRYNLLFSILEDHYLEYNNLFNIQVKKLFKLTEISKMDDFKKMLPYSSRGILFKPMFLKFRDILLNFDESIIQNTFKPKLSNLNEYCSNIVSNQSLFIMKTELPDIYNLYDDKKKLIGHAMVNSLKISKYLQNLFKNSNLNETFNIECRFNTKFNKWEPIVDHLVAC
jgi:hypothetical protein